MFRCMAGGVAEAWDPRSASQWAREGLKLWLSCILLDSLFRPRLPRYLQRPGSLGPHRLPLLLHTLPPLDPLCLPLVPTPDPHDLDPRERLANRPAVHLHVVEEYDGFGGHLGVSVEDLADVKDLGVPPVVLLGEKETAVEVFAEPQGGQEGVGG